LGEHIWLIDESKRTKKKRRFVRVFRGGGAVEKWRGEHAYVVIPHHCGFEKKQRSTGKWEKSVRGLRERGKR